MILLFLLLYSQICIATPIYKTLFLNNQIKTSEPKSIKISVNRYVNENAKVIILSHAFSLNNLSLNTLAIELYKQGFDVWAPNMRGHGTGSNKSIISNYKTGDYSFDNIITEDLHFLVKTILKMTKTKELSVVGHSIGGMSWKQYLGGIYKKHSVISRDTKISQQRSTQITRYIGITVPPHFDNISLFIKSFLMLCKPITKLGNFFIPIRPADWSIFNSFPSTNKRLYNITSNIITNILSEGLINEDNLEEDEGLHIIIDKYLSSPHTEAVSDFINWIHKKPYYTSKDQKISYRESNNIFTPTLMITGNKDTLSRTGDIISNLHNYNSNTPRIVHNYKFASHIDIICNKYAFALATSIKDFINTTPSNPKIKIINFNK